MLYPTIFELVASAGGRISRFCSRELDVEPMRKLRNLAGSQQHFKDVQYHLPERPVSNKGEYRELD